jgi:hypothetical protein
VAPLRSHSSRRSSTQNSIRGTGRTLRQTEAELLYSVSSFQLSRTEVKYFGGSVSNGALPVPVSNSPGG